MSENTLKISLETIADLLDLDFVNSYGAIEVKINGEENGSELGSSGLQNFDSFKFSEKEL